MLSISGLADERFLILPHPQVAEYLRRKADDPRSMASRDAAAPAENRIRVMVRRAVIVGGLAAAAAGFLLCRHEVRVGAQVRLKAETTYEQNAAQEFRWAGDPEGGAPFVEASATDPDTVVGFDVEIAELIARGLGRPPRFVVVQFSSLDQSIARGDADIGLSGIEDTPARRATLSVTVPYYEFREVLSVRTADAARFRNLRDLGGTSRWHAGRHDRLRNPAACRTRARHHRRVV